MNNIQLRDYQRALIEAVRRKFSEGKRSVIMQLPTGGGKGIMLPVIASEAAAKGKTVYIFVHRRLLRDQLEEACSKIGVKLRVLQGRKTIVYEQVILCTIQSYQSWKDFLPPPDLILIDEAHCAAAENYRRALSEHKEAFRIGLTATPWRNDGDELHLIFEDICQGPSISELIERGYLSPFTYLRPYQPPDISGRSGTEDYSEEELARYSDQNMRTIVTKTIESYCEYLNGKQAFVFTPNIETAIETARRFENAGISAVFVHGKEPKKTQDIKMRSFRRGAFRLLVSADLLSEGIDVPAVNGVMMLRPTKSRITFFQQIGRGLRVKPDGSQAIILDFVNNADHFPHPLEKIDWSEGLKPRLTQCNYCAVIVRRSEAKELKKQKCPARGSDNHSFGRGPIDPNKEKEEKERRERVEEEGVFVEWLPGVNAVTAKGEDYKNLIKNARSVEDLHKIARLRGYKPGWVYHTAKNYGFSL